MVNRTGQCPILLAALKRYFILRPDVGGVGTLLGSMDYSEIEALIPEENDARSVRKTDRILRYVVNEACWSIADRHGMKELARRFRDIRVIYNDRVLSEAAGSLRTAKRRVQAEITQMRLAKRYTGEDQLFPLLEEAAVCCELVAKMARTGRTPHAELTRVGSLLGEAMYVDLLSPGDVRLKFIDILNTQ